MADGEVFAVHDISDGGLAVAAAEMAIGADEEGLDLDLTVLGRGDKQTPEVQLFGEAPHRFLIEVSPEIGARLLQETVPAVRVGLVTGDGRVRIKCRGARMIDEAVGTLREAWRAPLYRVWPEEELEVTP